MINMTKKAFKLFLFIAIFANCFSALKGQTDENTQNKEQLIEEFIEKSRDLSEEEFDSSVQLIKSKFTTDEQNSNLFRDFAKAAFLYNYYKSRYSEALYWSRIKLNIDSSLQKRENYAIDYLDIGDIHYYRSKYNLAESAYDTAKIIASKFGQDSIRLLSDLNIVSTNQMQGNTVEAENIIRNSLKDSNLIKFPSLLSSAYNLLGITLSERGDYLKSIEAYQKALQIQLQNNQYYGISTSYNNIALLYMDLDDLTKAEEFLLKSKEYIEKYTKSDYSLGDYYTNFGVLEEKRNKLNSALKYHLKALSIYKKLNEPSLILLSYTNLGEVYTDLGEYELAKNYLTEARQMASDLNEPISLVYVDISLAELYIKTQNFKNAENILDKSLTSAYAFKNAELLEKTFKLYFEYYESRKMLREALSSYQRYKNFQDSLKGINTEKQMRALNALYESEQQKFEIERLQNAQNIHGMELQQQKEHLNNQRLFLHISISFLVIAIILLVLLVRNNKVRKRLLEESHKKNNALITSQKALSESEERFRHLAENIPAMIYLSKPGPEHSLIYTNPYVEILTGHPIDYFLKQGHKFIDLVHPEDKEFILLKDQSNESPTYNIIYRIKHKERGYIWVEDYGTWVRDDDGKALYREGFIQDITDRKRAEEEMEEGRKKAEESERIKSNFIANMSHELRTPLNALLGFADILKSDAPDEEYRNIAQIVLESGERLLETLNMILDLTMLQSRQIKAHINEADLKGLINEKVRLYESLALKKNLHLQSECPEEGRYLMTDILLLAKILDHLINNAIKYTHFGFIKTGYRMETGSDGDSLIVYVEDTGIGIKREAQNHIFHKFRQASEGTNREFEGTGLGLSITQEYVQLLNGSISVQSEENKGSVFSIRLPYHSYIDSSKEPQITRSQNILSYKAPAINPVSFEDTASDKKITDLNVLIVEDDMHNSRFSMFSLENFCQTTAVPSGSKAIETCKNKIYDIVLMDINLGGDMNGLEAMQEIKKINGYENCRFAAITANVMAGQKQKLIENGFDHYLAKPFRTTELKNLVRKMAEELKKL